MTYEIYSRPESYGLRMIGEVDWSDGCYQFDLTVVWQDTTTGALYYADDSGCSCPSPFEDTDRSNLTLIDRPQVLIDHVNERIAGLYDFNASENERAKGEAGQLVLKAREALR
ncbi:DUF7574 domain-containing protein [Streptomyces bacillaris]|uniref:DUF7574 domain-containing protein n=1 Tax=Streptomyces bacillaris TaxID=68179 RepID=UPI003460BF56